MSTPHSDLRRTLAALVCFAALLCLAAPAEAIAVRYRFEAEVGTRNHGDPTLLAIGTRFSASFVVNTAVPVPGPKPPRIDGGVTKAAYGFEDGLTVGIPGFSFTEVWDDGFWNHDILVNVWDDHECSFEQVNANLCFPDRSAPTDEIRFGSLREPYDPVRETRLTLSLRITDEGPSPSLIDGLEIPADTPSSPTAVGTGALWLFQRIDETSFGNTRFDLIGVTVTVDVPEPPRGLPLLAALLGVVWLGRVGRIAR